MALIDILASSINQFDDVDSAWQQFIADHKQYLINNARTVLISPSAMQAYTYSLVRYLRAINYNTHCAWIVRLINNLPTDIQLDTTVNSLLIPSFSDIESLYTTYAVQKSA